MTEGQLARAIIEEQFGPVVLVVAELLIQRFPGHASLETITRHCSSKKHGKAGSSGFGGAGGSGAYGRGSNITITTSIISGSGSGSGGWDGGGGGGGGGGGVSSGGLWAKPGTGNTVAVTMTPLLVRHSLLVLLRHNLLDVTKKPPIDSSGVGPLVYGLKLFEVNRRVHLAAYAEQALRLFG